MLRKFHFMNLEQRIWAKIHLLWCGSFEVFPFGATLIPDVENPMVMGVMTEDYPLSAGDLDSLMNVHY